MGVGWRHSIDGWRDDWMDGHINKKNSIGKGMKANNYASK